jgi:hypothetical protein
MCLAVGLALLALPLRFMPVPALAIASIQVAIAFAGLACAIAGWVWSERRSNIPLTLVTGIIVLISLTITVSSIVGRRPLIGIVMGFVWGVYYRRARHVRPAKLLMTVVPLLACAAVVVAAFTAVRSREDISGVHATVKKMQGANLNKGAADILGGQACGSASLWSIEQWPERMDRRPLYSLEYMCYWYVPRKIWPEKPAPLGNDIARLAKIRGVNWDGMTIPPGVIGYANAEGGLIAVIIYALFYGQSMKFFDHLVRLNPRNAYVILPAGCCIGQVIGMARGCIAIFHNLMIFGFISTFLILYVINKLFGHRIRENLMADWPQYPMVRQ